MLQQKNSSLKNKILSNYFRFNKMTEKNVCLTFIFFSCRVEFLTIFQQSRSFQQNLITYRLLFLFFLHISIFIESL